MYKKEITIRWSEIDSNLHLTSSAYVKYITDTRMDFFEENGFGLIEMKENNIGPVVLSEKCYYFKEIHPKEKIVVGLTISGMTEDKSFIKLEQRIFNKEGKNCFLSFTLISFIDLTLRKIAIPPIELVEIFTSNINPKSFQILSKSDLRDADAKPVHL